MDTTLIVIAVIAIGAAVAGAAVLTLYASYAFRLSMAQACICRI